MGIGQGWTISSSASAASALGSALASFSSLLVLMADPQHEVHSKKQRGSEIRREGRRRGRRRRKGGQGIGGN